MIKTLRLTLLCPERAEKKKENLFPLWIHLFYFANIANSNRRPHPRFKQEKKKTANTF